MKRVFQEIRRFIFWEYPRGCWQYDVMVALILAFIFLSPRSWFRDQPRIARASDIVMLPAEQGANVFWMEPDLLAGVEENERLAVAAEMVKQRTGRNQNVLRVETVTGAEGELRGYMVFAKP